jgi:hypothetical protein
MEREFPEEIRALNPSTRVASKVAAQAGNLRYRRLSVGRHPGASKTAKLWVADFSRLAD